MGKLPYIEGMVVQEVTTTCKEKLRDMFESEPPKLSVNVCVGTVLGELNKVVRDFVGGCEIGMNKNDSNFLQREEGYFILYILHANLKASMLSE